MVWRSRHLAGCSDFQRPRDLAHPLLEPSCPTAAAISQGDGRRRGLFAAQCPAGQIRPALPDEWGPKPKWSEVSDEMATANDKRPNRDVVEFPANTPVTVALKYPQG